MVNEHDDRAINRRGFLKLGGVTALVGVAAVACVEPRESSQVAQTGTIVAPSSTLVPPFPGSAQLDATYVLTAISVERLTVDTYGTIIDRKWLGQSADNELLRRLQTAHRQHADLLALQATGMGQDPAAVKPNNQVRVDLVDDEIQAIEAFGGDTMNAEAQTWTLILTLEDTLQQLYNKAGGTMTTPTLRQQIMSIGYATARGYTAAATFAGAVPVPFTTVRTAPSILPVDSYVQADASKLPRTPAATPGSTPGTTRP